MNKELEIAIKAAKESGKVLMKYFNKNVKAEKKSDNSPVTVADRESEKKIVSIIKKYFPDHNFLCEEFNYKKTDSPYKWIIDPLDGTRNFVRGNSIFGSFIALEKEGKIIAGAVNMPAMNIFCYASLGNGAFLNGKRAKVSGISKLKDAYLSFGDIKNFLKEYHNQFTKLVNSCDFNRGYGDALHYLLLAQGSWDIALEFVKPWDIAALKIIIEEAGGKVTDLKGNDSIYSGNALATNGKLHDESLKILNEKRK